LQLFQNISYLDLDEGEMGRIVEVAVGGGDVDRGRGSQMESMASCRGMLVELLNYGGFIGGDSVSLPQCSGQLGGGAMGSRPLHECV
jgi:hypothetical protein